MKSNTASRLLVKALYRISIAKSDNVFLTYLSLVYNVVFKIMLFFSISLECDK